MTLSQGVGTAESSDDTQKGKKWIVRMSGEGVSTEG
jgi:hypothetical protein